jgi:hypothetical protein
MRRVAVVVVLALAASSCAANLVGPSSPVAEEQLGGVFGLDVVAARDTVLAFLDAYANSGTDGARPMLRLVAGEDLRSWVRWLGVQNQEFDGTIAGKVELRSASFAQALPLKTAIGAQVQLAASVTFHFTPANGRAFQRRRVLDGPVTLIRIGLADWRIVDLTRDGVSMDAGITPLSGQTHTLAGVSVRLDSVFRFVPSWEFNLVVTNGTSTTVGLDPTSTALLVRSAGGVQPVTTLPSPSLAAIPPGATVDGLVDVPFQDTARGRVLALPFVTPNGKVRRFAFALTGLLPPLASSSIASPAPSPS